MTNRLTLTVPEAAQVLGLSRAKAYQMARSGELPTLTYGGRIMVPADVLRRRIEELAAANAAGGHSLVINGSAR